MLVPCVCICLCVGISLRREREDKLTLHPEEKGIGFRCTDLVTSNALIVTTWWSSYPLQDKSLICNDDALRVIRVDADPIIDPRDLVHGRIGIYVALDVNIWSLNDGRWINVCTQY